MTLTLIIASSGDWPGCCIGYVNEVRRVNENWQRTANSCEATSRHCVDRGHRRLVPNSRVAHFVQVACACGLIRVSRVIDSRLGNARPARVLRETGPRATACALKVDRGDIPVGRGWKGKVKFYGRGHFATPKRGLRLSRPFLSNGDNIPLTPAAPRNCTRQSATEPLPLDVTSSVPV